MNRTFIFSKSDGLLKGIALSILSVILTGVIIYFLDKLIEKSALSFLPLFLFPIIFSSLRYGMISGIISAFLSIFIYHLFLRDSANDFSQYILMEKIHLWEFIGIALFTSLLSWKIYIQNQRIQNERKTLSTLLSLNDEIASYSGLDNVINAIVSWLSEIMNGKVFIILLDENNNMSTTYPKSETLDDNEINTAKKVLKQQENLGSYTDNERYFTSFIPLSSAFGKIGLLGVRYDDPSNYRNLYDHKLFEAVSKQIAVAIERSQFADYMQEEMIKKERENLRYLLLSSISHDLKTPLAAIIGGCSAIQEVPELNEEAKSELIDGIREEAERLHSHISNILQHIKIDSDGLLPKKEKGNIQDIIASVLQKMKKRLENHQVKLAVDKKLPEIEVDFLLIEEVFRNIIDNAVKYSPKNTVITIEAVNEPQDFITVKVKDEGEGIPKAKMDKIFDKFYRAEERDMKIAGTGLGLSICKSILNAHNGTIEALNSTTGAVFIVKLPVESNGKKENA